MCRAVLASAWWAKMGDKAEPSQTESSRPRPNLEEGAVVAGGDIGNPGGKPATACERWAIPGNMV